MSFRYDENLSFRSVPFLVPFYETHGMLFPFCQSIYRQIQQLGLQPKYTSDEQFRILSRKLMALALVPLDKVRNSFDDIQHEAFAANGGSISGLLPYFEDNCMIQINLWNVFGSDSRTNNTCEGERKLE